jgi:Domain of unknown function (DUF389)
MLHVRVVCPAVLTQPLTDRLAAAPGVHNVVVRAGAARRPDGDAVEFDVRDAAANPVFTALRGLSLDRDAVICVERVGATLTGQPSAVRGHGALRRETAPVWEMVEAVIRDGEAYAPSFYVLLAIAALIGAVGILTNSQILIVGAMVVGPVADLINTPNIFSVIVAVLAGLVGVVSLTEARANALIGVFISVTTIPAAASVGVSVAYTSWSEARGSVLQLLLNVILLIAVGAAGLRAQRAIWGSSAAGDPPGFRWLRRWARDRSDQR